MSGIFNDNTPHYPVRVISRKHKGGECSTHKDGVVEIDWCAMMIRLHNGCRDGGAAYVPIISLCPDAEGNLPVAVPPVMLAPTQIPASAVPTTINHNLGYIPIVQVINTATGAVITDQPVTHMNNNTIQVGSSAVGLTVLIR